METLILVVHIILAVMLIVLILLQQGKGADAGASFGAGASQTVFGGRGSAGFLVKTTAIAAFILLITSVSLGILTKYKTQETPFTGLKSKPINTMPMPMPMPTPGAVQPDKLGQSALDAPDVTPGGSAFSDKPDDFGTGTAIKPGGEVQTAPKLPVPGQP